MGRAGRAERRTYRQRLETRTDVCGRSTMPGIFCMCHFDIEAEALDMLKQQVAHYTAILGSGAHDRLKLTAAQQAYLAKKAEVA